MTAGGGRGAGACRPGGAAGGGERGDVRPARGGGQRGEPTRDEDEREQGEADHLSPVPAAHPGREVGPAVARRHLGLEALGRVGEGPADRIVEIAHDVLHSSSPRPRASAARALANWDLTVPTEQPRVAATSVSGRSAK